jgi:hypothetical protein
MECDTSPLADESHAGARRAPPHHAAASSRSSEGHTLLPMRGSLRASLGVMKPKEIRGTKITSLFNFK